MIDLTTTCSTLGVIDVLLGLDDLSWSDARTYLSWARPVPAWVWALIALGAVVFAGWSYYRLVGAKALRLVFMAVRALVLIMVAALLAGPMLVLQKERIEPDTLVVLVDRSASMGIRDVTDERAQPISRDESLHKALSHHAELFSEEQLGKDRDIVWLGFDEDTYPIITPTGATTPLPEPTGMATQLRSAVRQGVDHVTDGPISGVVLFTDGRSPQATGNELTRSLTRHAISVFPVPLGAAKPPLDIAIARLDAPIKALVDDTVPIRVWLDCQPADAHVPASAITVDLIDAQAGRMVDQRRPAVSDDGQIDWDKPVRFSAQSKTAGQRSWHVQVRYEPPRTGDDDTAGRELLDDNNKQRFAIEFVDRPIRVLYIEGYPRWEYRYLKNTLVRETGIESSIVLLNADADFAQEGDVPLGRLPHDAGEWQPFDVIIIGDVRPGELTAQGMALIRDHVATRGAGLLWIGGTRSAPVAYDATPLAELLPMRHPSAVEPLRELAGMIHVRPTPLAQALNVLQLHSLSGAQSPDDGGSGQRDGNVQAWPDSLPALWWAQRLGTLQPTAEVIAQAQGDGKQTYPIVTRLRYGAGQAIYVATDETWRWRFGRGELYFEQFWVQLVHMLGRGRLRQSRPSVWMDVSHRRVASRQPVVVDVVIEDALLLRRKLSKVSVQVFPADDPTAGAIERFDLRRKSDAGEVTTIPRQRFTSIWRPAHRAPHIVLRAVEPALAHLDLSQTLHVVQSDDEIRQIATDHPKLAALASDTGGKVVLLNQLNELTRLVPNRARRTPIDQTESLWDSPLALAALLVLLTLEWLGRKLIRLA